MIWNLLRLIIKAAQRMSAELYILPLSFIFNN